MGKQGDGSRRDGFDQTVFCYPQIADKLSSTGEKATLSTQPPESLHHEEANIPPSRPARGGELTACTEDSQPSVLKSW